MRQGVLLAVGTVVLALLASGCGGGKLTAEEVVQRAYDAIDEPGKVYHIKGDNGSEVWMDPEAQKYRRQDASDKGGLISTGEGWMKTTFDPFANATTTQDESPKDPLQPRVDNPAVQWLEPLTALAYARSLEMVGKTVSVNGRSVIAVIGRSPVVKGGKATGGSLVGRVEVDPETFDIVFFERRQDPGPGEKLTADELKITRVTYGASEHLDRSALAANFFDKGVVEDQVVTLEESIAGIKNLNLDPYWVGEEYAAGSGALVLNAEKGGLIVDPTKKEGSVHYSLRVPAGAGFQEFPETVVVKLGAPGTKFAKPAVEGFSGTLPEDSREETVRGGAATLYRSVLTPSALPCPKGQTCAPSDEALYYHLNFTVGQTAVQLETSARVDQQTGEERNVYNSESGILELAEALTVAE